jgi:hypothetical protein
MPIINPPSEWSPDLIKHLNDTIDRAWDETLNHLSCDRSDEAARQITDHVIGVEGATRYAHFTDNNTIEATVFLNKPVDGVNIKVSIAPWHQLCGWR